MLLHMTSENSDQTWWMPKLIIYMPFSKNFNPRIYKSPILQAVKNKRIFTVSSSEIISLTSGQVRTQSLY